MLRNFFKVSSVYAIQNVLQRGIEYLLLPIYFSIFTTVEYGKISMCIVIISSLTSLFSLSLDGAVSRYFYKYNSDKDELKEFLGSILSFLFLFLIFISIIFLLFSKGFWELIIPDISFKPYIYIAIIISAVDPINRLFFSFLLIKRDLKNYAIYFNLYFYFKLLALVLVSFFTRSVYWYLISYLMVVLLYLPLSYIGLKDNIKWGINRKLLMESISYSVFIIPVTLMSLVNSFIDKYIVLNRLSLSELGIFSAGVNLSSVILLIATVLNQAFVSFFIQKYEEKGKDFQIEIASMSDMYFFIILILTVFTSLFITFFEWILPDSYNHAIDIIPLFVFVGATNGLYFLYTNYMSLEKRLVKYKVLGFTLGILINFPVSYILTSHIGIYGAAIGTLSGFFMSVIVMKIMAQKIGGFNLTNKYIYYLFVFLLLTSGVNYYIVDINVLLNVIIRFIIFIMIIVFFNRYYFTEKNYLTKHLFILFNYGKNNINK